MASRSSKSNAAEIDRLALALAKEPGSKAFIPLAEEYGKAGMWQEAAAVLEDGLKTYPNFIIAMVALGRTYEQLNQPVKAKAILEEAVKLSPENLRAHRTLAKIYVAEGAKEAALRSCRVILAVNPHDEEARSLQAVLHVAASDAPPQAPSAVTIAAPAAGAGAERPPTSIEMAPPTSVAQVTAITHKTGAGAPVSVPPDKTIARLEQWLASIQRRRRDRRNDASAA